MKRILLFVVVVVLGGSLGACTDRSPRAVVRSSPKVVSASPRPTPVATPTPVLAGSNAIPARGVATPPPLARIAESLTADADGWFVYSGTATTTIAYYDVCGTSLGQASYSWNVDVFVGPPLVAATGESEQNPFYLQLGPPQGADANAEGVLSFSSAGLFPTSYGSQSALLQYWSLQQNESTISGQLYDEHTAEAATANLLSSVKDLIECQGQFGYLPWQWPVERGATLQGTLDDNGFHVQISGNVIGGIRPFAVQIDANRVG